MSDKLSLQRYLERALAFAHAALDEPSFDRLANARRYAAEVGPRLGRIRRFELTLGEARQLVLLMNQLRAVLAAVDANSSRLKTALAPRTVGA